MIRNILSAAAASALIVGSVSPAFAQANSYAAFQAPEGPMASINFKVPLGGKLNSEARKASYGLTLAYGQSTDTLTLDGYRATRQMPIADLRFTGPLKLWKAEVATFDLANLEDDKRLNMTDDGKGTVWIIGGIVVAGVVICLLADCFDSDDDDDDDNNVSD